MDNWFSVEIVDETIYAISEYKHWEEMHSYLLIGNKRALMIDTGLGIGKMHKIIEKLTNLPVDVVTTHVHWDHIGGHEEFERHFVHELDSEWMRQGIPIPLEMIKKNVSENVKDLPETFDMDEYEVFRSDEFEAISDGYSFELGNRRVEVIHTPGHSPGHICLYEPDREYLFTGDLAYKGTLYCNYPSTDPKQFRESIERIRQLNVKRILPSHHELDISGDLIEEIYSGFESIRKKDGLVQGNGLYEFEQFKIHM